MYMANDKTSSRSTRSAYMISSRVQLSHAPESVEKHKKTWSKAADGWLDPVIAELGLSLNLLEDFITQNLDHEDLHSDGDYFPLTERIFDVIHCKERHQLLMEAGRVGSVVTTQGARNILHRLHGLVPDLSKEPLPLKQTTSSVSCDTKQDERIRIEGEALNDQRHVKEMAPGFRLACKSRLSSRLSGRSPRRLPSAPFSLQAPLTDQSIPPRFIGPNKFDGQRGNALAESFGLPSWHSGEAVTSPTVHISPAACLDSLSSTVEQNPKPRATESGNWRSASGEGRSARGGYQNTPRGPASRLYSSMSIDADVLKEDDGLTIGHGTILSNAQIVWELL
ncbi:hypothetical protein AB5N19_12914 [Seiridium cardinale]